MNSIKIESILLLVLVFAGCGQNNTKTVSAPPALNVGQSVQLLPVTSSAADLNSERAKAIIIKISSGEFLDEKTQIQFFTDYQDTEIAFDFVWENRNKMSQAGGCQAALLGKLGDIITQNSFVTCKKFNGIQDIKKIVATLPNGKKLSCSSLLFESSSEEYITVNASLN